MTFLKAALGVVAVTALSGHVAPSVDDNNRYLKVTPLRDGFRLAYTVFFGEVPGAQERRNIDDNRDSRIDEAEAKRFADKLAAQVAGSLDIDTDGVAQRVQWMVISPGMGSDAVAAGAFSIDLIAFICAPGVVGDRHTVRIRDQFRVPRPGETEVKVEDSPGITVHAVRIGEALGIDNNFRFVGPGGPLSDDGLLLEYTGTDKGNMVPTGKCFKSGKQGEDGGIQWWRIVAVGATMSLALLVGMITRRRRTSRRA